MHRQRQATVDAHTVRTKWPVLHVQMIVVVHNDVKLSGRLLLVLVHARSCAPGRGAGFAPDAVLRIALRPRNRAVGDATGAEGPVWGIRGDGLPDGQSPCSDTTAHREEGDGQTI
jgi:hypothetical protein